MSSWVVLVPQPVYEQTGHHFHSEDKLRRNLPTGNQGGEAIGGDAGVLQFRVANGNLCSETNIFRAFHAPKRVCGRGSVRTPLGEPIMWSRGSLSPPQRPHHRSRPSASIFGPSGFGPPFPTPISGYAHVIYPMKAWYEAPDVSMFSLSWWIALRVCGGAP